MRIIDRYVIREVLWPFVIGLVIFTFMLIIPDLIERAETFIAKGVPVMVVLRVMATLLPSVMALTIPMSLLLGLLVAFGRLSADREFVAMQACGVSLPRLLRPVALLAVLAWAATSWVLFVSVPSANQTFREITFSIVAERAEGEVRPRVFFEDFPDVVLYVREIPVSGGGWNDVFMADYRPGQTPAIYLARRGRVLLDRDARTVQMELEQGQRHTADPSGKYEVFKFDRLLTTLNPEAVFPLTGPAKGDAEMTIAELQKRAAEIEAEGGSSHNQWMYIHQKFSIPFACLVFGVIGLALGATSRRDGKLASFVIAGTLAGTSGYFAAAQFGFVNPDMLGWHLSGSAIMMVILGGMGTLGGAALGAFVMMLLELLFQGMTKHWQLLMGGSIVGVALLLPHGLLGTVAAWWDRRAAARDSERADG